MGRIILDCSYILSFRRSYYFFQRSIDPSSKAYRESIYAFQEFPTISTNNLYQYYPCLLSMKKKCKIIKYYAKYEVNKGLFIDLIELLPCRFREDIQKLCQNQIFLKINIFIEVF